MNNFRSGGMNTSLADETPNGSVTVFTYAGLVGVNFFFVTLNGLIQLQGEDFTYNDSVSIDTITFAFAPPAGSRVGFITFEAPQL
jgi:hypothetical protein